MKDTLIKAALSVLTLLTLSGLALAETDPPTIKVRMDGRISNVTVATKDTNEVIFYAESTGNISTPFNVVLEAPSGVKLEASMATIRDIA